MGLVVLPLEGWNRLNLAAVKPVVIDLCCGLGGWSKAFLDEGWDAVGFDIERHEYTSPCPMCKGTGVCNGIPDSLVCDRKGVIHKRYPGELILADVLKLNGYDLRAANPSLVVASPPCTEYSYMAMPFSRGKAIAKALRGQGEFPEGSPGLADPAGTDGALSGLLSDRAGTGRAYRAGERQGRPTLGRTGEGELRELLPVGAIANVGGRIVRPDSLDSERGQSRQWAGSRSTTQTATAHPQGSWFAVADSQNRGAAQKSNV